MTSRRHRPLLVLLSACALHCTKPAQPAAAPTPAPASAAPAAASMTATPRPELGARLQQEARSRPQNTPRADALFAALEAQGVTFQRRQQHLGATYEARYCEGGVTGAGTTLSVCEYADPASARAGRELAQRLFSSMKDREVHVHKASTLIVMQPARSPESEAVAKRALDAFRKL